MTHINATITTNKGDIHLELFQDKTYRSPLLILCIWPTLIFMMASYSIESLANSWRKRWMPKRQWHRRTWLSISERIRFIFSPQ